MSWSCHWFVYVHQAYLSFLISDILALALKAERQIARMSEIKNGGLDLYDKV